MLRSVKIPKPLVSGDKIVIVSPASIIDPALVDGAVAALAAQGWNPWVAPHALGVNGTMSGSRAERLADMRAALSDADTKAIMCARGGYGAVHLLADLDDALASMQEPKWLIGFSDISALHGLWHKHGMASVHGSMARHLALFPADDAPNKALLELLHHGIMPHLQWSTELNYNRPGSATGTLMGGNLAVLSGLIASPYSLLLPDTILFIEDIAESIYKVERMLYQLRLSGVLANLRGLVVGRFTDYRPDPNHPQGMESMIAKMIEPYHYPVAFNAPIGHVPENMPVIEGANVAFDVDTYGASITYIDN